MKKTTFTLFFIGVLMALTLASCSKESQDDIASSTKSVELKIAGLTAQTPETKAIGNETKTAYAATLSSATVIFYSGDNVYNTYTTSTSLTISDLENGHVFHGINKRATDVMVVGNKTVTETTITQIKAKTVSIEDEQGQAVTLVGASPLGAGSTTLHPDDGDDIVTLYEVNVEIAPLVARFEIKSIECSDLENFETLVLNRIGLFNFAEKVTLDGTISGPIITLGKYTGETGYTGNIFPISRPVGVSPEYPWYQFGVAAPWSFDNLGVAVLTPAAKSVTAGEDKVWAYNFIPEATTNIMLQMDEDSFVRTNGFTGTSGFEAGKIYQMEYTFKEENIGTFDPDAIVCAEVTVTVKKWDIVEVAPTFE